jgi:deazaflavin-dependent oxidoreductase (nitroreductase family)
MNDFNDRIIAEFRANNGRVTSVGFGSSLVLIHTRGAKTGKQRVNPAMSLRDGSSFLVVASAMGAEKDPAWAVNLRAHPRAQLEVPAAGGIEQLDVEAEELEGSEYEDAFARFVKRAPAFDSYQQRSARRLPVIRLNLSPDEVVHPRFAPRGHPDSSIQPHTKAH